MPAEPSASEEALLDERYELLSKRMLEPLSPVEAARLEEIETRVRRQNREHADSADREYENSPANRLERSLDRLEEHIENLTRG